MQSLSRAETRPGPLEYVEAFYRSPVQGFAVPLSSLSSWFTGEHVKDKRAATARLIKSLAKQQTPGSSFGFPDLGFGEAEMEEPSDRKTPRRRRARGLLPGSPRGGALQGLGA